MAAGTNGSRHVCTGRPGAHRVPVAVLLAALALASALITPTGAGARTSRHRRHGTHHARRHPRPVRRHSGGVPPSSTAAASQSFTGASPSSVSISSLGGSSPTVLPPPAAAAASSAGGSPLAGARFYVNPDSPAAEQERTWQSSDPADAAEIAKIADEPEATWFGNWNSNVTTAVAGTVQAASSQGTIPVLVAYNIPLRDCGGYSSGGATSAAAYRAWIGAFAAGIGNAPAVVILEPDALAGMDCLSAGDQATRLSLLGGAVSVLASHPAVQVYLDAGNADWQPAAVMAARLNEANVAAATGFSLNVSNFDTTSSEAAYGQTVSALVGGKHFVIDTSRNGVGTDGQWCNPPDRALGTPSTGITGIRDVDAFLWIKDPGESDGTCNGGPTAGTWWPQYALGLAERAAF